MIFPYSIGYNSGDESVNIPCTTLESAVNLYESLTNTGNSNQTMTALAWDDEGEEWEEMPWVADYVMERRRHRKSKK